MQAHLQRRALALAAGVLLACASPAAAGSLGHEGRWLTDVDGRVVVLHGFNMVNKLPPYQPAALGFDEDDARFLAEHGFNTVRLGVIWKGLEPRPGQMDEAYLEQTAATVRMLAAHGIHVLVDFHQDMYNERFNGEGFPDWAVIDDGLPNEPDFGFPLNYLLMPALWRAFDHFWANDLGLQGRLAATWRRVADRFRDEPFVLGYNLLNEPWPGSQWPTCVTPEGCPAFDLLWLTPFSQRIIAAIRAADDDTLVWYAPNVTFDFGARTWHGDTGDPNAGFAFNAYCLVGDQLPPGAEDGPCGTTEERVLQLADEHAVATGDALLMTEFGATDELGTLERMLEAADRHMLSWQQWAYWNADPSGRTPHHGIVHDLSRPPEGDNVKREKLAVSARPFPRAVAGTPLGWDFDRDDGAFELRYATRDDLRPGLETEVFLPQLHYPDGYDAQVTGAQVTSPPGARVLRLVADPGATVVEVRVSPR